MGAHGDSPIRYRATTDRIATQLGNILAVAAVPLLVVSQWVTVRWDLPGRFAFNLLLVGLLTAVLILRSSTLGRYRIEVAFALGIGTALVLSIAVNSVPARIALWGVIPYAGVVLAVLAGLTGSGDRTSLRRGAIVSGITVLVMAAAALLELAFGGKAYQVLGQSIEYPRWWERGRATGLVANPGRLSQIAVAGISLVPAVGTVGVFTVAAAVAGAFLVGASGTRIALAAALSLIVGWFLTRSRQTSRLLLIGGLLAPVMFAIVIAVVPAARADFFDRSEAIIIDGGEFPADVRVANAAAVRRLVADRPLLGAGPGRFGSPTAWRYRSSLHEEYGLPDLRSEEFVAELRERGDDREIDVGIAQLDLGWGQVLAETGVLGLVLFGGLLLSLLVKAVRARSSSGAALVLGLSVLSLAAPGLVDFSLAAVMLWWAGSLIAAGGGESTVRSADYPEASGRSGAVTAG